MTQTEESLLSVVTIMTTLAPHPRPSPERRREIRGANVLSPICTRLNRRHLHVSSSYPVGNF